MKTSKLQPWTLRAALQIYRDMENRTPGPLGRDQKSELGSWARIIQQAHDDYGVAKRDHATVGS